MSIDDQAQFDFFVHVGARFKQNWEAWYRFRVRDGSVKLSHGTRYYRRYFTARIGEQAPWRVALAKAASLWVGYLIPPQALRNHWRFEIDGWEGWRAELIALALLRENAVDRSMYGRAFLSLTDEQAEQLRAEFPLFFDRRSFAFVEFLEKWRTLDAIDGFDRHDLGGFLTRFGFPRVPTAEVLRVASIEHEEGLKRRPPAPPRRGLIDLGFRQAEELGWMGVTLTAVGRC